MLASLAPFRMHIGDDFGRLGGLWGSLGLSGGSLRPPGACLGTLSELSWDPLLKGAPGGLRGSFSVDLSVDF